MSRSYRLPCGCKSNDTHWLEMCATHKGEFDEIHHRAAAEKAERQKPTPNNPSETHHV